MILERRYAALRGSGASRNEFIKAWRMSIPCCDADRYVDRDTHISEDPYINGDPCGDTNFECKAESATALTPSERSLARSEECEQAYLTLRLMQCPILDVTTFFVPLHIYCMCNYHRTALGVAYAALEYMIAVALSHGGDRFLSSVKFVKIALRGVDSNWSVQALGATGGLIDV